MAVAILLLLSTFTNSIYADPPRCESYQVEITLKSGESISGFIHTSTSEYVLYHEPGTLRPTDFLKQRDPDSTRIEKTLNLFEEIHQFTIPVGFVIIAVQEEKFRKVQEERNWYRNHRELNRQLWKDEHMVIICHSLE